LNFGEDQKFILILQNVWNSAHRDFHDGVSSSTGVRRPLFFTKGLGARQGWKILRLWQ